MNLAFAWLALAGSALIAAPALATGASDPAGQFDHFHSIQGPSDMDCINPDRREQLGPEAAIAACQSAIAALQDKRRALKNPKPYEAANFDYYEVLLLSGLTAGQAARGGLSAEVCANVEKAWKLRFGLQAVPSEAVQAGAYKIYHSVPPGLVQGLGKCRSSFGAPAGAPPLPTAD